MDGHAGEVKVQTAVHPSEESTPRRGRVATFLVLGALAIAAIAGGVVYWLDARHYETTDDAFLDGHVSQVAARISGPVTRVAVRDNQFVRAGDPLVTLDDRDQRVRLDQARASEASAVASLDQARAQLAVRQADAAQARANIAVADADLFQAGRDLARYRALDPKAVTRQQIDTSTAASRSAAAKREANIQAASSAEAAVRAAAAQVEQAQAALEEARANTANAQLQLDYTTITAPADGRVTRKTVELGNYVAPGQALLAIVQPFLWVTANFKENQLADLRPGQKVRIRIDAFPDARLEGHVDSLQTGTGQVFSAIPSENATGNYVKIVQRLPVKIVFDGEDWRTLPLAPGMSVVPRVTVR